MTTAATSTEDMWAERIRAWKASGQSAQQFAEGRGVSVSALRYWSKRLSKPEAPRLLRVVPKPATSQPAAHGELVVEVGSARIRVSSGFDPALLRDVIGALGGGAQ